MNRYNCHNCNERCKVDKLKCNLRTLFAEQLIEPRKVKGFTDMMEKFKLKVVNHNKGFSIVSA